MNNRRIIESIEEHFRDLPDLRVSGRCEYRLIDLIIIAVCASITGANSWVDAIDGKTSRRSGDVGMKIAKQIRQQEADYVLALKENQGRLYDMVRDVFSYGDRIAFAQMKVQLCQTVNKSHGRIEVRRCQALSDPRLLTTFQDEGWADLTSVCRLQRERHFPDRLETETVYFISSLPNDAVRLLSATRSHWSVENQLHWLLDVQFREDDSRIRAGDAAENMAVLRHISLNILKRDTSKGSLRIKRYRAAMNTAFLESFLALV